MVTMNISLPDDMKAFAEEQAARGGFPTVGEYVRSLLNEAQMRERYRLEINAKLLEALDSGPATAMTQDDWDGIRAELDRRAAMRRGSGDAHESTEGR